MSEAQAGGIVQWYGWTDRMRTLPTIVLILAIAAGLAAGTLAAPAALAPEPIDIALDSGTLKATLFRPEGPGPFPAVVGLHGCAGLVERDGAVALHYRDWAERLVAAGFVVIYPDSYGSRGLGSQCMTRRRSVRSNRERVADAEATRRWLQTQPFVEARHVTLLGWSTGATSVLWTVRRRAAVLKPDPNDFRSAVSFYPGCRQLDNAAWSARIPTLILIGAVDDWASAQLCQRMVGDARGRGAGTSIVVYPASYHEFDHPDRPLQVRTGYANSTDNSGKVRVATNPAARADALKRVAQWLAR
jgi:dienelactone hydrolase